MAPTMGLGTAGALLSHDLTEHAAERFVNGLGELPLGVLQLHFEEAPLQALRAGRERTGGRGRGAGVPVAAAFGLRELLPQVQVEAGVRLGLRHLGLGAGDLRGDGLDQAEEGFGSEGGALFELQLRGEGLDQACEGPVRRGRGTRREEAAGANGGAVVQRAGRRRRKGDVEVLGLQPSVILHGELPLFGEGYGGVVLIVVQGEDELTVIKTVPFSFRAGQLDHDPSWKMPLGASGLGATRGEASSRAVTFLKGSADSTPFIPASPVPVISALCHFLTLHCAEKAPSRNREKETRSAVQE